MFICVAVSAQTMRLHNSGDTLFASSLGTIDSIKFDNIYSRFSLGGSNSSLNIQRNFIDSITFSNNAALATKIFIIYNGTDNATIINPYAAQGVAISATGGIVSVTGNSGISNLEYNLIGSSSAGSFSMSSTSPATIVLNNVNLTNANGAVVFVTGAQMQTIVSKAGTTNTLTDGSASTRNGVLQTDGKIILSGTGALVVNGLRRHGIFTTAQIEMQSSNITVNSAVSDGFHSEGFAMSGGSVNIAASSADGIDAGEAAIAISNGTLTVNSTAVDVKAIKTGAGTITITGGTINLTVSGNASKAISAKGNITIGAGTFAINLSGAALLTASGSGYDPSYCTAVKTDGQLTINGGVFTLQSSSAAIGAKGFSADGNILVNSGNFTITSAAPGAAYTNTFGVSDYYNTTSFSADGNITILGGTILITNTGAAGRGFKADVNLTFGGGSTTVNLSGPTVLTAQGSGFNPTYPTGAKADGLIYVNAGTVAVNATSAATGARGLSADSIIDVSGGTVTISVAGNGAVYTNSTGVTDSYAAAAFSADRGIIISAGTITTTSSGTGGKGIKSDGTLTIGTASTIPVLNITTTGARFLQAGTDYNHPKTIVATGAITILNGILTANSTDDGIHSDASVTISGGENKITASSATTGVGEGIEAPIINFTGGITNVTASNDGINATYGTVSGGIESNDNSQLNISGGILIVAGSDAIDSNGNITITGGTTIVCGPTNQPEEGMDFNGTFLMNGGLLISGGSNSNMTKSMAATSTQVSLYMRSTSQLAATSILHIENAAGTEIVNFKPKNGVYYFHFSSPSLAQSSQYKVYFGGTYTGGSFTGGSSGWGLYTGGTYSLTGATLKTTINTSASAKLNSVQFQ